MNIMLMLMVSHQFDSDNFLACVRVLVCVYVGVCACLRACVNVCMHVFVHNILQHRRMSTYSLTTAPVTKQGESPLAVAVGEGNLDMTKCLVNGCNANVSGE